MDKLVKIHRSLADWNFKPTGWFSIIDTDYVSPPSCLRLGTPLKLPAGWAYLKLPLGANIPQGQFISWRKCNTVWNQWLAPHFRVQLLPTNDYPANCYYLSLAQTNYALYRREAGTNTVLKTGAYPNPFSPGAWRRFRLTWYEYIGVNLLKILRTTLDMQIDTTWTQQFFYDDTANKWSDSTTNRIGFLAPGHNVYSVFDLIDNTEIWKAIT